MKKIIAKLVIILAVLLVSTSVSSVNVHATWCNENDKEICEG